MDNVTVPQTKAGEAVNIDDLLGSGSSSTANSNVGSLLDIMADPMP